MLKWLHPSNWRRAKRGQKIVPVPLPEQGGALSSDRPITKAADDRFGRWPFASRIAETLRERRDPSSIVIGVYAPWGDGKTSVMNMMEQALADAPSVICVRFNPWYFRSDEQLIRGFFDELANAIGKKLPTRTEELAKQLGKYAGLLSFASAGAGDIAKTVVDRLSTTQIEELKVRVETLLGDENKRVIVFIDDIDRLDRREIQSILKLVKLSADFSHTAYVLFFDDNIVAEALGERYGAGDSRAGRAFLEKIVQVPLHLPPANFEQLRQIVTRGLQSVVADHLDWNPAEQKRFSETFNAHVMPCLDTPRQAARYLNAATFALPTLRGEVSTVDLLLIEAVRTFLPTVYSFIRANGSTVLGHNSRFALSDSQWQKETKETIEALVGALPTVQRDPARSLLKELFPRLAGIWANPPSRSRSDDRWADGRRVCAERYFNRYFHYGVPPGDVADSTVEDLIVLGGAGAIGGVSEILDSVSDELTWAPFMDKLHRRAGSAEPEALVVIALELSRRGSEIPTEADALFSTSGLAAQTVARIVGRLPSDKRASIAVQALSTARPLWFAGEIFSWCVECKDAVGETVLPRGTVADVAASLVKRFEAELPELDDVDERRLPNLLWIWITYGKAAEVSDFVRRQYLQSTERLIRLLSSYCPRVVGSIGTAGISDFRDDGYKNIASLIDPVEVMSALTSAFGDVLESNEYYLPMTPFPERVARQFSILHRRKTAVAPGSDQAVVE